MATTFDSGTIHTYTQNTWAFSDVVAGADGKFYLAHKADGYSGIEVMQWDGSAWLEYASFTAGDAAASTLSDDLDLVVDASGNLHIVFRHETGSGVASDRGVKYGVFNGTSWSFSKIESASDPSGWKNYDDPSLAVDANGVAHVAYKYSEAATHTDYLKYATNSGGTWSTQVLATGTPGTGTGEIHDPWVAIGADGSVNITFVKEDDQNEVHGNLYFTAKASGGTFSTPSRVINAVAEGFDAVGQSAMDAEGKIHNVFYDDVYDQNGDFVSSTLYDYTNVSGTWVKQLVLTSTTNFLDAVSYQDTGTTEYLLVREWDADFAVIGARIYYRHEGGTWMAGNVVPIDPASSEVVMAVGADGTVMVITEDSDLRNVNFLTGDAGVAPANPSPIIDANGAADGTTNTATHVENGPSVRIVTSDASLTDDDNLTGMTLVLTPAPDGIAEQIAYNAALNGGASLASLGLSGSYDSINHTFTISGTASATVYQGVLRAMSYSNGSDAPSTTARTVTITVTDAEGATGQTTATINITAVNDAPTATNLTQTHAVYEGGSPLDLTDIVVSDPDGTDTITATLTLSTPAAGTLTTGTHGSATSIFNTATGVWSVTGSVADVNAALAAARLVPSADWNQDFTITTRIRDSAGAGPGDGTISVAVTPVNDAPVANLPGSISLTEDTATALTGISFSDIDAGSAPVTVVFEVPAGSLSATSGSGVVVTGSASVLTLTGTIADINAYIAASGVTYSPAPNDSGARVLTISIIDGGNTGTGGSKSDIKTVNLNIAPVNDAPVVTVPGSIALTEDTTTALTGISFADLDAGSGNVVVTLSVPAGTLSAVSGSGVAVGGTASALTLTGTIAAINAYIAANGVRYTPALDYFGTRVLTVSINDGGNGGASGSLTDTKTVNLNISSVNDAPVATVPPSISVTEDTPTAVTGISFWDVDAGAGIVTVTFSVPAGALSAASGAGVTVAGTGSALTLTGTIGDINAFIASSGVTYTPAANDTLARVLTVSITDNGNIGAGGSLSDTNTITLVLSAVNDAPVATVPSSIPVIEDSVAALTGISFSDVDAGSGIVTVTLSVPAGTLSAVSGAGVAVGGTASALILTGTIADINSYIGNSKITYLPPLGFNGTHVLTVTISDGGNGGSGGSKTHTVTVDLNVAELNDAPSSANNTVTLAEDGSYTFKIADFAFADLSDMPPNGFKSIVISAPPAKGSLTLDGQTVVAGQEILLADIGRLIYTPDENEYGLGYSSFVFRVRDDGGTLDGGNDTSGAYTMQVNVTSVSDAPYAANRTILMDEDTVYTFRIADFGFQDTDDVSSGTLHTLKAVIITGLPTAGRLTLDGADVVEGQSIDAADIGNLEFLPAKDANGIGYATFKFKVQDNGGVADGGEDTSEVDYTVRIDVSPANDNPSGVDDGPVVVIEAGTVTAGAASGVLANDPDIDGDDLVVVDFRHSGIPAAAGSTILGAYGQLTLNADGGYTYIAFESTRAMRAGQTVADTFEYSLSDGKGGTTTASITFQVEGRNAAAVIGGDVNGSVIEDAVTTASGTLTVSDEDLGEASFQAMADVRGSYGTFSFDHLTGEWSYLLDNASPLVQALDNGEVGQETFKVMATDGTERSVTVLVNGTSDINWIDLDNTISGGSGRDTIFGGAGSDRISAGRGNDYLDGGSGNDTVLGGSGNDRLYGGTGSDSVSGGTGSDRVYGGSGNDRVYGNSGNDRLYGDAGNDLLSGGSGNDVIFGGNGRDTITGSSGNDKIYGGLGADLLNGGAGRDSFVFDTRLGNGQIDTIKGFNPFEDRILLDHAVFKKLGGPGKLDWGAFRWGSTALDADDRILYDITTGTLSYDADGNGSGAAVKFAKVEPWRWLTHDSFKII